jgi:hypothetical protein
MLEMDDTTYLSTQDQDVGTLSTSLGQAEAR